MLPPMASDTLPPGSDGRRITDAVAAPKTTAEEDRKTAGQRRVNILWEATQAFVTLAITCAEVYAQLNAIDSKMLDAAFFAVISTYLARTNHSKIGGVGGGLESGTR